MRRCANGLCSVFWCALAVLMASHAMAQSIPVAPISSGEIDRYADRLALSRAQQQALAAAHQEYLREFRERFGRQIERYLALRREVGDVPFQVAPRESFFAFTNLHRTLTASVRAADEELLRSIEPMLTEEQQAELGRVIDARRRAQILAGRFVRDWLRQGVAVAGELADLTALLDKIALSKDGRDAIDDVLRRFEPEWTRLLIELESKSIAVWESWRHDLDARGYRDDPDIDETYAITAPAWEAAAAEGTATMRRLRAAIRRAADEIVRALPEPYASRFHAEFYRWSYRSAMTFGDELRRRMDAASELQLDENAAEEFARLADSFATHDRRYVAILADRIDASLANAVPRISRGEGELKAELERIAEDRRSGDERMQSVLAEILGPERFERTAPAWIAGPRDIETQLSERHRDALDPDEFVPAPIARETLRRFADALALNEGQRSVLEALHDDYRRAFLRVRQGPIEEMITIYTGFSPLDDGSGMHGWTPAENDHRKHALRLKALASVRELDERLLRDIEVAVLSESSADEVWRLRLARAREFLRPHLIRDQYRSAFTEHRVDLLAVLDEAELPDDERAEAEAILQEWVDDLIRLARELHRASVEASYRFGLSMARDRDRDQSESLRAQWHDQEEARMHGRLALAALARAIRDDLIEHLPSAADRFYRAYDRSAYPNLFADENALHGLLEAARALEGLTSDQRAALGEIIVAYRREYERLTAKMIEVAGGSPYAGLTRGLSGEAAKDFALRRERIDILWLERDELAGEALVQLRQSLTSEQLAAIGAE